MQRLMVWSAALVIGALSGCGACNEDPVPVCDATYGVIDGPAIDASADAMVDARPDAMPDATPLCTSVDDTADHLEPIGGLGGTPQMTADGFGAVAAVARAGGGRLALLGANGARRAPDLDLTVEPHAIAFDGLGYRIVEQAAGPTVQLRTVAADGTLGTPIVIGAGQPVYGAIAVHASGDVAVLWRALADGSLRATVVPATGVAVETVLDTPVDIVNTLLVGGLFATTSASARFVAAYAAVDSINGTTVMARPLAPAGTAVAISAVGVTQRHRVGIAGTAAVDTALITWRDDAGVHVATYHPVTGVVLTDRIAIAQTAAGFTRVAGRAAGTGYEILLDRATGADRGLFLYEFDAAFTAVGTARRIATICTNAYSEENLSFVRNSSVRYVTWYDMTLPDNVAAAF